MQPQPVDSTSQREAAVVDEAAQLDASRFLMQATFGPKLTDINRVVSMGREAWLADQFQQTAASHLAYVVADPEARPTWNPPRGVGADRFETSFFTQAMSNRAQLRQRVAFALSEIFVVSFNGAGLSRRVAGIASYHDMLGKRAFGTYRELLEAVTRHPMMGIYLSSLKNEKADGLRLPDENYAREVMQLFSIGLYELNPNGTPRRTADGQLRETYTQDDIANLARVFTGWSWACAPGANPDTCFRGANSATLEDRDTRPMQANPTFHSLEPKRFLDASIDAGVGPGRSLELALDALANHRNVGPFFGRQLIQRLVTSNPTPGYVKRVADAFDAGTFVSNGVTFGTGVRGDLQATIAAVLLDSEARTTGSTNRLREPVLTLTAFMRAFDAQVTDPLEPTAYRVAKLDDPTSLSQFPYFSPSVFNFFRPGYTPPLTEIADAGQVAPEFQIATEVSIAGYANLMRTVLTRGVPTRKTVFPDGDAGTFYVQGDFTDEAALAHDPDALVSRVKLLLTGPRMRQATFDAIKNAVLAVPIRPGRELEDRTNRARLAAYLTLISPDFLIQ